MTSHEINPPLETPGRVAPNRILWGGLALSTAAAAAITFTHNSEQIPSTEEAQPEVVLPSQSCPELDTSTEEIDKDISTTLRTIGLIVLEQAIEQTDPADTPTLQTMVDKIRVEYTERLGLMSEQESQSSLSPHATAEQNKQAFAEDMKRLYDIDVEYESNSIAPFETTPYDPDDIAAYSELHALHTTYTDLPATFWQDTVPHNLYLVNQIKTDEETTFTGYAQQEKITLAKDALVRSGSGPSQSVLTHYHEAAHLLYLHRLNCWDDPDFENLNPPELTDEQRKDMYFNGESLPEHILLDGRDNYGMLHTHEETAEGLMLLLNGQRPPYYYGSETIQQKTDGLLNRLYQADPNTARYVTLLMDYGKFRMELVKDPEIATLLGQLGIDPYENFGKAS